MDIQLFDHSSDIKEMFEAAKQRGLEAIGLTAEGYAKKLCPVDTGRLRNSISHAVDRDEVYIGSNAEYAVFVELGTGIHYPTGRKTPWFYKDAKGKGHTSRGSKAQPYLKPAATEHSATYKALMENEFRNS